jgi:hypothetical protein
MKSIPDTGFTDLQVVKNTRGCVGSITTTSSIGWSRAPT